MYTLFLFTKSDIKTTLIPVTINPEEDEQNKRERPLPSRRLSLQSALICRWLIVPVCWVYSYLYSFEVLYSSMTLAFLTMLYNECGFSSYWISKNILNAAGVASYETGAAFDFKDIHGDAVVGRRTLPIVHPRLARISVLGGMAGWSFLLTWIWELDGPLSCLFCALSAYVAYRFLRFQTVREDQISYYWYNVSRIYASTNTPA
ncbi:hypothetical protein M422DRAFT_60625 [Sphaerobolus stellatus SS14]|uniref:Uncharacterized protein n=1 Tax=Sphaerobolus stellatus (strain SS14) TaxID=990650 RepID=A0A0C9VPF0_SPHS4|nr:hypothetical protein M422DRAFT_60625 [Sphaerobolus stellatus SS14]